MKSIYVYFMVGYVNYPKTVYDFFFFLPFFLYIFWLFCIKNLSFLQKNLKWLYKKILLSGSIFNFFLCTKIIGKRFFFSFSILLIYNLLNNFILKKIHQIALLKPHKTYKVNFKKKKKNLNMHFSKIWKKKTKYELFTSKES